MTRQRPTLLALIREPGELPNTVGGSLALYGWRGADTALVILQGGQEAAPQALADRATTLLGIGTTFHWAHEPQAERLARLLRSLRPQVILAAPGLASFAEQGWRQALDPQWPTPGLAPLATPCRLWEAEIRGPAQIDVSAAAPLLRALRVYDGRCPGEAENTLFEGFAWRAGATVPAGPVTDLFVGLSLSPLKPPISFLAEDNLYE